MICLRQKAMSAIATRFHAGRVCCGRTNARRQDRHKMFFPVLIDTARNAIVGAGDFLPLDEIPDLNAKIDGYAAAWPIRTDGSFGNWGVGPTSLRLLIDKGICRTRWF